MAGLHFANYKLPFANYSILAMKTRCPWAQTAANLVYHDTEWGVPQHDDQVLFEFLILEGAQAGLSWTTILLKRENYRQAFDGFDAVRIARYSETKVAKLMADPGIVRNRLKIAAAVQNARSFLAVRKEYGTFDRYIWQFVGGRTLQNRWHSAVQVPAQTLEADRMSKDLCRRGFKFVGPTICYAFMQAVGLVNDHLVSCFRHREIQKAAADSR
jgi:DNA-3-methyladenine glycosylase I